jgi:hypothetical protein
MKYFMDGIMVCMLVIAFISLGMLVREKKRRLIVHRADSSLESICDLIVKSQEDRYETVPIRVLLSMGYDPEVNPQRWN